MYYCKNCHRTFSVPIEIRETYGLPGRRAQRYDGCPHCRETGTVVKDCEVS